MVIATETKSAVLFRFLLLYALCYTLRFLFRTGRDMTTLAHHGVDILRSTKIPSIYVTLCYKLLKLNVSKKRSAVIFRNGMCSNSRATLIFTDDDANVEIGLANVCDLLLAQPFSVCFRSKVYLTACLPRKELSQLQDMLRKFYIVVLFYLNLRVSWKLLPLRENFF